MMINEMKNSRSSDLLPMFYDCKYYLLKLHHISTTVMCFKDAIDLTSRRLGRLRQN